MAPWGSEGLDVDCSDPEIQHEVDVGHVIEVIEFQPGLRVGNG
jgi:hypothetical protein